MSDMYNGSYVNGQNQLNGQNQRGAGGGYENGGNMGSANGTQGTNGMRGANGTPGASGMGMPGANGAPGYHAPGMPPRKKSKKTRIGLGIFIGVIAGILLTTTVLFSVADVFYRKGYIHFASNGEVYVQGTPVDDSEGIGSDVESKLNALDSVLDNFYFGDVDEEEAADNIYKAYLDAYGDRYTVYYTPEEYQSILESTTGKFYGIGAVCQKNDDGTILISEAYEDAPAYKAGIRDGDCVTKVDGRDITGMDLSSAVALIKGDKGTSVELEVRRGGETLNFKVVRDEVNIKTVEYSMLDDGIGYIAISQFDNVTTQQFKDALEDLQAQNMKGLVVDIRSNPGGVLSVVVDILDEILPDGLIVYTEDKYGNRKEYKGSDDSELSVPLAVLVNGDSASASEIFAGAVQDYNKGAIIGTQTFGKGIVQTIQPLTDGSALKYTIAKYFTPKGQDIHGNGVTPDIVVELPEDAESDVQLEAALNYVKGLN